MTEILTEICAWCDKTLVAGNSERMSHGICTDCCKKVFDETESQAKEHEITQPETL